MALALPARGAGALYTKVFLLTGKEATGDALHNYGHTHRVHTATRRTITVYRYRYSAHGPSLDLACAP